MLYQQIHQNDRQRLANELGLPLEEFDRLVASANDAHTLLTKLGPFYGREDIHEPTFRITAEPVRLPEGSKKLLTDLGNDLFSLGKALQKLPLTYQKRLGRGLDMRIPQAWRIDAIIEPQGTIKINEIEGIDSVSALMMAEQLAYRLQPLEETTIFQFIEALKKKYPQSAEASPLMLAIIRNLENNPFTPNARRFIEFLRELSKGTIGCDLFDINQLKNKEVTPDWNTYTAILNEAYASPDELQELGIAKGQLLNAGNYNAMVNKGVFAVLHEQSLSQFWIHELGKERFDRLTQLLIPSRFIRTEAELEKARQEGKVCKVSWADNDIIIINRAKGIAMPTGDILESENERWELLKAYLKLGYTIIAQDFVEPARIFAFLRKRGTTLEPVEWYNRLCVKYVVQGEPNGAVVPPVALTATEVTLGPEIIPAGRKCAFTAGKFV